VNKPERQIHAEHGEISPLKYSCDFNYGYGHTYYIEGKKQQGHKWCNLAEFDFSLGNRRPEKQGMRWPTFEGEHWIGGSSLELKETGEHVLQFF